MENQGNTDTGHVEYLSAAATAATRVPSRLPEGYLEALANLYQGILEAIRSHIEGTPLQPSAYDFPTAVARPLNPA